MNRVSIVGGVLLSGSLFFLLLSGCSTVRGLKEDMRGLRAEIGLRGGFGGIGGTGYASSASSMDERSRTRQTLKKCARHDSRGETNLEYLSCLQLEFAATIERDPAYRSRGIRECSEVRGLRRAACRRRLAEIMTLQKARFFAEQRGEMGLTGRASP